jgi:uncharacterized protein (TIGR02145 family)
VDVVWDDNGVINKCEKTGSGKDTKITVTTNNKTGNAVVKIYRTDNNKIIWSYHIWVTNPVQTWENTKQTAGTYIFMDRSLGATEAANSLAGRGLLYQWGRKDPFPGGTTGTAGYAALASKFEGMPGSKDAGSKTVSSSNVDGAIIESILNPARFYSTKSSGNWLPALRNDLWNSAAGDKTIYDPCPAGWRVPVRSGTSDSNDYSPWKGFASTSSEDKWGAWTSGSNGGGMILSNDYNEKAYYAAGGYRYHGDGAPNNGGYNGTWWTSSVTDSFIYTLYINYNGAIELDKANFRAYGYSVRCVKELDP